MPPRIRLQKLLKSPENRGKIAYLGVKNGGFPPFFIGLMSQRPDFRGVGRLFLRVCIDVVTIKIIVAMYVAYIV